MQVKLRQLRDVERFHRSYRIQSNGCWQWIRASFTNGYGQFTIQAKPVKAHRWAYKQFVCDPGDQMVLHRCHNKGCVNYAHLYLGTNRDNQIDYHRTRGTHVDPQKAMELTALGYTQREAAEYLGCSQAGISKAITAAKAAQHKGT